MRNPQTRSAWLGLALVLLIIGAPAYADVHSDLVALAGQTNTVAGNNDFNLGERVSLVTKHISALAAIDRGNENAAAGLLGAFVNEFEAVERSGRISSGDADALINSADAILSQL